MTDYEMTLAKAQQRVRDLFTTGTIVKSEVEQLTKAQLLAVLEGRADILPMIHKNRGW